MVAAAILMAVDNAFIHDTDGIGRFFDDLGKSPRLFGAPSISWKSAMRAEKGVRLEDPAPTTTGPAKRPPPRSSTPTMTE
jgi:hypothetical protein